MAKEKHQFQAEVSRLLEIVAHSLYSDKEIFIRELISNASDACDKLRYLALTEPDLLKDDSDLKIKILLDKEAKTITFSDNGIGMSHDDLAQNLGTIAKSGTSAFLNSLEKKDSKDVSLIGQFGVGFYSSYIVSDKVTVTSKKAGETESWTWESDGKGEFVLEKATKETRGTDIVLHIKEEEIEFLEDYKFQHIIKKYSDHINFPIEMKNAEGVQEAVNSASAIWSRQKSDVTAEQYKEFYHHVAHAFDDPWMVLHNRVEGVIEYTNLLYIPTDKPFDLFQPERQHNVKLYVKRIFISDKCEGLLPAYLRFVKGVVDSNDLPLNISREMLQNNPVLSKISNGITKRILGELSKKADKSPEEYTKFWTNFGSVLKEGLYEDFTHRDQLLKLVRFKTTKSQDNFVSLEDYISNMAEGQKAIYTISGENLDMLKNSPQLEGFVSKGIEVIFLTDPIDEFWVSTVGKYNDFDFKSVTRGSSDLDDLNQEKTEDKESKKEKPLDKDVDTLVASLKLTLKDKVKDVRVSSRLTDSPVCLVADETDMDMHLEKILRQHKQVENKSKRILEINPEHVLISSMTKDASKYSDDVGFMLYDQAIILEGEVPDDPSDFSKRLSSFIEKGLKVA